MAAIVGGVAAPGLAHDEDWRKLRDRMQPFFGPIWTASDPDGGAPTIQGGFESENVELLAHIPINNFAGNHNMANDCWGYVSPAGREYAILGLERGFGFVEVSDPLDPQIIETIPGPASLWHDVKVIGQFAYGVSEGGSGIQVMDLREIDEGVVTLLGNVRTGGHSTTHNIVADTDSGNLYLCGANIGNGGLIHVDTSDPASPVVNNGWTQMYVHDAQVVTYDSGPFAGREIAFCASGFNGGFSQTGLRIVDITDKDNAFTVATLFYANAGYAHQVWLSEDRQTLYLNDELDEQTGQVPTTTTRAIDVSDIENPQLVGTFTSGSSSADHNLYTRDGLIFEANYTSGLRIFDAHDPVNPEQVGFFDTFPGGDGDSFNGAWSVYPFFPSGTVIVSDLERGLFVLAPDVLTPRIELELVGAPPEVLDPAGGETITVRVEEADLTLDPSSVAMSIDDGTGVRSVPGTPTGEPGAFAFTTPTLACGDGVEFWFSADSTDEQTFFEPRRGPDDPFAGLVASDRQPILVDDFETDLGWTVTNGPGLSAGQWERGVPAGGDRGDPSSDFDGSGRAFLTENDPGNSDVDDGATTLTSPVFDATGGDARLSYARWYSNSFGNAPFQDVLRVEISNDGGQAWVPLETVGPDGSEVSGGWFERSFRIADFIAPTPSMRVRFIAEDADPGSVVEAAVDDFAVEVFECEPSDPACPADLTGPGGDGEPDGALTSDDFFFYLGLFAEGDPQADLTGPGGDGTPDGGVTADDFFFYLALFAGGCG